MQDIIIQGNQGEGGGQILRTSLSLSVILRQSLKVINIRANRDKPGLRPQHLTVAQALARLSEATLEGGKVGSAELTFHPTHWEGGDHTISIGTAGATSLLLHALFYPMAKGDEGGVLTLEGGTHNDRAPSFPYLEEVWQPLLRQTGMQVDVALDKVGVYPKGGGVIRAEIPAGQTAHGVEWLTRPPLSKIRIVSMFAHPKNKRKPQPDVARRMAAQVEAELQHLDVEIEQVILTPPSASISAYCGVFLTSGTLKAGFDAFGRKGLPAEEVGKDAARQVLAFLETDAVLDEHASDQMLLPLAMATSPSQFTTTTRSGHLETNADIIKHFLPHVQIEFEPLDNALKVHIIPS
ncbi:MAG TPA: RNA 3'-phosphate cyclase [Myxococcales bacterium]|nr:RNA 3'-phosphate cyclase [Deltaproteobacteria bacterium]HAA58990.1 RNA 3'-phosphate cyclase [Myxococcales bacterium]|tara:strand:- start:9424 stop:10476 length:1053 start_codon:yes stop_codon:yes gene_type:complete